MTTCSQPQGSGISVSGNRVTVKLAVQHPSSPTEALCPAIEYPWDYGDTEAINVHNDTVTLYNKRSNEGYPVFVMMQRSPPFQNVFSLYGNIILNRDSDNQTWVWGDNSSGCVGTGDLDDISDAETVTGGHQFFWVATNGFGSIGIDEFGQAWGWGIPPVGDGEENQQDSPVSVVGDHYFLKAVRGINNFSVGIDGELSLYSWGYNADYQLGIGNTTAKRLTPTAVSTSGSFSDVSAGAAHAIALDTSGNAWGWGDGSWGQIGNGIDDYAKTPSSVIGGHTFTSVCCSAYASFALKSDGSLYSWGLNNFYSQLGHGDFTNKSSPESVIGGHSFWKVAPAKEGFVVALESDGSVITWGYGPMGTSYQGVVVTNPMSFAPAHNFSDIAAGDDKVIAKRDDGSYWGWGDNTDNLLLGYGAVYRTPEHITDPGFSYGDDYAAGVNTAYMVRFSDIYSCGFNGTYGLLGNNTTRMRQQMPPVVDVYGSQFYSDVTACKFGSSAGGNYHTFGVTTAGKLYGWGRNNFGQIGDSSFTDRTYPVGVDTWHSYIDISCGLEFSAGLRPRSLAATYGPAYTWGLGGDWLGQGAGASNKSSPDAVLMNYDFSQIACGPDFVIALHPSGAAKAWGNNDFGQLGIGSYSSKPTPNDVSGSHNFDLVQCGYGFVVAHKSDGTLWVWGEPPWGGGGTSPTQLSTSNSVTFMAVGNNHLLFIDDTGKVWGVGNNQWHQLGVDSDDTYVNTPTEVYGSHAFAQVYAGATFSMGKLLSGQVYFWGSNEYNQAGNNSGAYVLHPQEIKVW